MEDLPMFPLGSVLLPHQPLPLRLFEPRYLMLLGRLLEQEQPRFGTVLIERGQEVGGGDQRFDHGTVARIVAVESHRDHMSVVAVGTDRFRVSTWLPDAPYPRASVEPMPPWQWEDSLAGALRRAETVVRRARELLVGDGTVSWPDQLSDVPLVRCWQVAGLAPIGELDRLNLLRSDSPAALLHGITASTAAAVEGFAGGWPDGGGV